MAGLLITCAVILAAAAATSEVNFTSLTDAPGVSFDTVNDDIRHQGLQQHSAWPPTLIIDLVETDGFSKTNGTCDDGEYLHPEEGCTSCKTYESECEVHSDYEECCSDKSLKCRPSKHDYRNSKCRCKDDNMQWEQGQCISFTNRVDYNSKLQFMTAAQVALGCALIIAVAALAALTCKMCATRRRMEEATRFHRDSGNASLNSVQRFVLGRMRDRPPRYDDVPDKPPEYGQELESEVPPLPLPRIPVAVGRVPGRRIRMIRPPPTPPAYSEIDQIPSTSTENTHPPAIPEYEVVTVDETLSPHPTLESELPEEVKPNTEIESVSIVLPEDPAEDSAPQDRGVDNPAFTPECHM
ncbi:uncharacterized protein LOC132203637 isoform X2 [Neocloeon triangulifer]|uniref:uncharacterized protein LOC132203637 isoform X2 n=1 Tax=Neocloeon triangulifer TaxID=2078957 RepID=UPI00286F9F31|nr:uncharacterized protein LOC132203637 isoform X2 [Neocloeon triangulifer]